jgi:hypothetical protein
MLMVTAPALLTTLRARGVTLTPWGDRVRVRAPSEALTDDVREALRTHKAALLDRVEAFEERAALMEFDGGLSRAEAERFAWDCLCSRVPDAAPPG